MIKRIFLLTLLLLASPAQASIILDDASSQYASSDTAPVTAMPFSISVWVKTDQTATTVAIGGIGDKDVANQYWVILYAAAATNDPLYCRTRDAGGTRDDATIDTAALSMSGNWRHVVCVWASATSRTPYISASAGTAGAISTTPTGADRVSVGRVPNSTGGSYWSGRLAEFCVYDIALSSTDITNLYNSGAGTPCTNVQNADLIAYYKLISDANDSKGTNHLTTSGSPTFDAADHPVSHATPVPASPIFFQ